MLSGLNKMALTLLEKGSITKKPSISSQLNVGRDRYPRSMRTDQLANRKSPPESSPADRLWLNQATQWSARPLNANAATYGILIQTDTDATSDGQPIAGHEEVVPKHTGGCNADRV